MSDFVNWTPFIAYARENDISVAITEFGGHPSVRCNNWLDGFLQMMEKDRYIEGSGRGGVIMWQLWRVCPHTSWYASISPTDPSGDCVQVRAIHISFLFLLYIITLYQYSITVRLFSVTASYEHLHLKPKT